MAERITKQQLNGMLSRATASARRVGALTGTQEFALFVPWSHAVIVVRRVDGTGGVRAVTERGGTVRDLYEEAHTLAVAFEMVEQQRNLTAMAHTVGML